MTTDSSSPRSCTPSPIPTAPDPRKCIHEFAQKVLPVLERVLLVIAGGQNLFCFFWLRYQAIISCNYFESCYRWISELSVLNRIHYSNAGSSLLQRGGHGAAGPPLPATNARGEGEDVVGSACQSHPCSSLRFPALTCLGSALIPGEWGCLRGAGAGSGCGQYQPCQVQKTPNSSSKLTLDT